MFVQLTNTKSITRQWSTNTDFSMTEASNCTAIDYSQLQENYVNIEGLKKMWIYHKFLHKFNIKFDLIFNYFTTIDKHNLLKQIVENNHIRFQ